MQWVFAFKRGIGKWVVPHLGADGSRIHFLFKTLERCFITGKLVAEPVFDAINRSVAHAQLLRNFFAVFLLEEEARNQNASPKHDALALGEEVAKKELHGVATLDAGRGGVEHIKRPHLLFLSKVVGSFFHVGYFTIYGKTSGIRIQLRFVEILDIRCPVFIDVQSVANAS